MRQPVAVRERRRYVGMLQRVAAHVRALRRPWFDAAETAAHDALADAVDAALATTATVARRPVVVPANPANAPRVLGHTYYDPMRVSVGLRDLVRKTRRPDHTMEDLILWLRGCGALPDDDRRTDAQSRTLRRRLRALGWTPSGHTWSAVWTAPPDWEKVPARARRRA